jgi:hypothetical protein
VFPYAAVGFLGSKYFAFPASPRTANHRYDFDPSPTKPTRPL